MMLKYIQLKKYYRIVLSHLIFLLLLIAVKGNSAEIQIEFSGRGSAVSIDSVQIINLRSGQKTTLFNNQVLNLKTDENGLPDYHEPYKVLKIYPNPCNGNAYLDFQTENSGSCIASIFNSDGRMVTSTVFQSQSGINKLEINLSKGVFFVNISGKGFSHNSKVISNNNGNLITKIKYGGFELNTSPAKAPGNMMDMLFIPGDKFIFRGYSGNFTTILPYKPALSEKINIDFYNCTDASGNYYPVIILGNQVWMAENLKTMQFRNNENIANIKTDSDWKNTKLPAFCSFNNTENTSTDLLYNWHAVNDNRIIAPEGWHVPGNNAWKELENFLKDNQLSYNQIWGIIEPDFGYRTESGSFGNSGNIANYWTATSVTGNNSYKTGLSTVNSLQTSESKQISNGFYIRCVRPTYSAIIPAYQNFDINKLPEILLEFNPEEWNKLLTYFDLNPQNEEKVIANFTFKDDGIITVLKQTGLKLRGNTSRRRPEGSKNILHDNTNPDWHHASFSVDMNEFVSGQKFSGLKNMNLKWFKDDPMYAREVYCYDLFERFGVWAAPESSYCKLYIYIKGDARPAYFGVYNLMESINSDYLKKRKTQFGDDKGFLWKANWGADLKTADASKMGIENITLTSTYKPVYDLKNRETELETAKIQLLQFIKDLNQKTGTDFETWIESKTDVPLFLKTYAVNVMCGMWDDYWANKNNFYFYFNSAGKFFFIPYDYDNTLGTSYIMSNSGTQNLLKWGNSSHPLVEKIIAIPKYKSMYINYLHELNSPQQDLFYVTKSKTRILNWHNLIKHYISNDTDEDMVIADRPASWGNCSFYRLLEDQNNYFLIRGTNLPPK